MTTPTTPAAPTTPAYAALSLREGVSRLRDYWVTVYKRTWTASLISSFVTPLFYVVAMGVLLGGFIADDPDRLEGASSYLAFVVPGLIAAHAMQTAVGETTYPVMGMIKWHAVYYSMLATPLTVRHVVASHLGFVAFRLSTTCAVYLAVLAPFGVFESWWGPVLALLAQVLTGMAFATLVYAFTVRITSEAAFGVLFRLGVFPLFLFSGAFFPVGNLGPVGSWVARATPLWQGVNLSRMLCLDHVTWWVAGVNVAVLGALCVLGWKLSVRGLERRVVT